MKFNNTTVLIQLLFIIVVVAVIATHFRTFQMKELFETAPPPMGVNNSDKNTVIPGSIIATSTGHTLGNSKLPDTMGQVVLEPNPDPDSKDYNNYNKVILKAKAELRDNLCFTNAAGKNERCYNADTFDLNSRAAQALNISEVPKNWSGLNLKRRDGSWTHFDWVADGNNYLRGKNTAIEGTVISGPGASWDIPQNWTGANFKRRDGRWTHLDWMGDGRNYVRGNTFIDGTTIIGENSASGDVQNATKDWTGLNLKRRDGRWTHFDKVEDQRNYIRGETVLDGDLNMMDNKIRLRNINDNNHVLQWHSAEDGPRLTGYRSGALGTQKWNKYNEALKWDDEGVQIGTLKIGKDGCIRYGNNYRFCLQTDGNVVQYKGAQPVWSTNRFG